MSSRKVGGTAEAAKKNFPTIIYVGREQDLDDYFFVTSEHVEGFDDGDAVAVYELKEVKRKVVEHSML